ncbi:MAG: hypothetical protein KBT39_13800 [Bacteroidales bacterium]|nr:hypothetical protein [Bacteroidales bacterium]
MKNIKIAAFALLSLFATTKVMAEEETEDFESVTITNTDTWGYGKGLSNGWQIVGGTIYSSSGSTNYGLWSTAYNGSKKSLEASYSSTNSAIVVIPEQLTGTFKFYARKTSTSSSTKGYVDLFDVEEDGDTYKKSSSSSFKYWTLTSTTWTEYTVDLGDEPRMIAICLSRAAIDDVVFNTYEAAAGPRLQVLQGGKAVKSGADYNFGLVAENATVQYTIKNAGTETMNATLACTGAYSVSDASVSLAANEEKAVTITLSASALGSQEGALTISPEGLDAFTINLAGIVRDPAKLNVDFSEAPANWVIDSNWTIADGYAKIGYYSSYSGGTGRIETPLISVAEDETIYLRYSKNTSSSYSSAYFYISTSVDGVTWTKLGSNHGTDAVYGEWKETTISGIPTNAKYIAISGQYIAIDDFYGLTLSADPVMVVTAPKGVTAEGNTLTDAFGVLRTKATHTYTISNPGAATLEVALASNNTTDFTLSTTSLSVAPGESATFDLTFNIIANNYGAKEAAITLTPNAGDVVTINASAESLDPSKFYETFEEGIPSTWTNTGWTIPTNAPSYGNGTKMAFAGYSNANTLVTPRLMALPGDVMYIDALQPWNDESLTLEYSLDDGETWNVGFSEVPEANNTLHTLQFAAPQAGVYLIRFSGRYNYIDNVYGFRIAPIPGMEITSTTASKEGQTFTDKLGITNSEARHTYTVKNTGSGSITLTFNSDNAAFSVSPSTLTIAQGASADFEVVAKSETAGEMSGTITINSNCGLPVYTINASATFLDPAKFYVDFEDGIPADWTNGGWQSSKGATSDNETKMAYSYTSDDYLVTPLLQAKAGETIQFEYLQVWQDEPFSVEYTINDVDWNEVLTIEKGEGDKINKYDSYSWTAPADGFYKLRFKGKYYSIDNVYGFALPSTSQTLVATDGEKYYATFSAAEDIIFAPGVEINTVSVDGGVIKLTKVENNYVPAGTGVLLSSSENTIHYMNGSAENQIAANNMLVACTSTGIFKAEADGNNYYKLAYGDNTNKTKLGFWYGNNEGSGNFKVKAGGAVLCVPGSADVKGFSFDMMGEETAIEAIKNSHANGAIYNLQGQRMQKMQRGINIVNGKKIMVK